MVNNEIAERMVISSYKCYIKKEVPQYRNNAWVVYIWINNIMIRSEGYPNYTLAKRAMLEYKQVLNEGWL